ncbi:MAG: nucleotide exchange factor GrpE, partial [Planctomycetaceae bacterium]|nr:nucleotide exchange factor GrpE [Planctomycetaceae bacterium]
MLVMVVQFETCRLRGLHPTKFAEVWYNILDLVGMTESMSGEHLDLVSEPEEAGGGSMPQESVSETEQLRAELEEAKNRTLRALADLENYRTRVNRQMAEERKYASLDLMRELLPMWDNIGRALESVAATHNLDSLVEGVEMVHSQFLEVLKKYHCEKIDAKFQPFDPNIHASVAQIPSGEYPANTVL